MKNRMYVCIDLKSFYASVECIERELDPMTTNLVVADESRTEKTICLAVSPSLKSYGIPGRTRLFEVIQKVKEVNKRRIRRADGYKFTGASADNSIVLNDKNTALDYIVAMPRMALYMEYSTRIYRIYLKYVAPEDIHVYSIDEVFIDVTDYLKTYKMTAHEMAVTMIRDVYRTTGITATVGIGTNLYLAKIAMDIVAKHVEPDTDGVRIAELDEMKYRRLLWTHTPITDFWRVGRGYAKKLAEHNMYTMGDVARCSIGKENEYYNEDLLYKLFGINAELLIDHAWGWEPCSIKEIKEYKPQSNSIGSGQVLQCAYDFDKAKLVTQEMIDLLVLDLVDKGLVTDQIVLTVEYDIENLKTGRKYSGQTETDRFGRRIPKHAHGTANLGEYTSSTKRITEAAAGLFDRIVDKKLTARKIYVTANHVIREADVAQRPVYEQLDLFTDYDSLSREREKEADELKKEKQIQHALLDIKKRYGKNAVIKGMNMREGATAMDKNKQIGGHKA